MVAPVKLQEAVGLVLYELWMLRECAHGPEPDTQVLKNLQVEGLVLHARVLRDFFFTKVNTQGEPITRADDIVAVDYFTGTSAWPHTSANLSPYLVATKVLMDRALAHLSYDRLGYTGPGKGWWPSKLLLEIGDKWFEFLRRLQQDNEPAASWFIQQAPSHQVPVTPPF